MEEYKMTTIQTLLGNILRNRINAELKKDKTIQNYASIREAMDIFLAGDKITAEQYEEFTGLITPVATASYENRT
jgi:hypothetical protein